MKTKILQEKLKWNLEEYGSINAIEYGSETVTYKQLDEDTNYIANWLMNKGIEKETVIGIITQNKSCRVSLVVAILKIGGIFVILDPEAPAETQQQKINAAKITRLIGDSEKFENLETSHREPKITGPEKICVKEMFRNKQENPAWITQSPAVQYEPNDRIYITFTNDTHGEKENSHAVAGKSKSLLHLAEWEIQTFEMRSGSRFSQSAQPGLELVEIIVPLCAGGTIIIPGENENTADSSRATWLSAKRINHYHCTAEDFRQLAGENPGKENLREMENILIAGTAVEPRQVKEWYANYPERITLAKLYGTEETTYTKACYQIRPEDAQKENIPIGQAIKGARLIILNEQKQVCDQWINGDIYIRTPYLSSGYIDAPELDKEKFIPNPFSDNPQDVIYRTGQTGMQHPGGNIQLTRTEKAGPVEETKEEQKEIVPPKNEIQQKILEIWNQLLKPDEEISTTDEFHKLGGNSINIMTLVSIINREFDIKITLAQVFKNPTIQKQAAIIEKEEKKKYRGITPAEKREYYPLSSTQKRLYLLQKMEEGAAYNSTASVLLEGPLDKENLENTFKKLIRRHESFRTTFHMNQGEPVQKITEEVEFAIDHYQLTLEQVHENVTAFIRPFAMEKAPLCRVSLVELEPLKHLLVVDMHHIISDGVSQNVLIKDFMMLYSGEELAPLPINYKDYAQWQTRGEEREEIIKQKKFWMQKYEGEIPVLNIRTDYPRPSMQDFEGDSVQIKVEGELDTKIKKLREQTGATLFMILFAAYNILLMRYSRQQDIVTGTLTAGREHIELENVIGAFINTLPIRSQPYYDETFESYLETVKTGIPEAFANSSYHIEDLIEDLGVKRDTSRNPLYDTMFMLQNMERTELTMEELTIEPYTFMKPMALLDLRWIAVEERNEITIEIEYAAKLFKDSTVNGMGKHYLNLLAEIVEHPQKRLCVLPIMAEKECAEILERFNGPEVDINTYKTITKQVAENALKQPEKTALHCEGKAVTYKELEHRSEIIAGYVKEKGIGKDSTVGILLERSAAMVESIAAVWKAGGAYIPLDLQYPPQRIAEILEDSGTGLLITQKGIHTDTSTETGPPLEELYSGEILYLDKYTEEMQRDPIENNELPGAEMEGLAYVIYTSGSTGKPKGVMVEHIGMMNHMDAKIRDLHIDKTSIIAQNASHTFDISIWQFFAAIVTGGTTVIYPDNLVREPAKFIQQVKQDKITILEVVPSYLTAIMEILTAAPELPTLSMEYLMVTGEVVKPQQVRQWFENYPSIKMVNAYGPTEASDDITHYIMKKAPGIESMNTIPIGIPLQNFNIYTVDDRMNLCPMGVEGEICVSGTGVGRGYLKDEAKTKAAFTQDPFGPEKGRRMYKTGDLGALLPDGTVEFRGRKDFQVKIRGFRIELEEIEKRVMDYPGMKETVAAVKVHDNGEKYLCTYYVCAEKPKITALKNFLAEKLPYYMIPSYFLQLEKLPLTTNGKIDRKALPEPGEIQTAAYTPPETETEKKLVETWSQVLTLEKEKIGVENDFFELGGHSLKATVMVAKIEKETGVKISLVEVFRMPIIKALAAYIDGKGKGETTGEKQGAAPGKVSFKKVARRRINYPT
ncbi:MAG: amino acid adenylation domain-containing protein [bacterium]|nr:amino acid adenylation domain-containing protein [bacterium]